MKTPAFCIFLLFMLPATTAFSQADEHFKKFNGNKVYIVYLGNKEFDSALKKAIIDIWTASPIAGFITPKEVDKLIHDRTSSFIIPREWIYIVYLRSLNNKSFSHVTAGLFFLNGGKKKLSKYEYGQDVVSWVDFDHGEYEYKIERAKYRLPLVAAQLNASVQEDHLKHLDPKALKNKTLLINKNLVEKTKNGRPHILKEALSIYKYKYEIADEDRITSLINAHDSSYAFFIPVIHHGTIGIAIFDLGSYHILWTYVPKKMIRFPWVREYVFEQLNSEIL